jgi:hypothetical protein
MYNIRPYHLQQAAEFDVTIKPSTIKNYKLDVFKDGKYLTSIGDRRYKDYIMYLEEDGETLANKRRRLYWLRHQKDNGVRGFYARNILW